MKSLLATIVGSICLVCAAPSSAAGTLGNFVKEVLTNVAASVIADTIENSLNSNEKPPSIIAATTEDAKRTEKIVARLISESVPLNEKIGLYATSVDYFRYGVVDQSFIIRDRAKFERRWPRRSYVLVSIDQIAVAPDKKYVVARYTLDFEVSRPGDTRQGRSRVAVLIGTFDSQPRIHAIKEWVER